MQKGDSRTIGLILKQYKFKNGDINFPAIFSVPIEERLPALFKKDMFQATALVVGALTMAFKRMKLKKVDGELINDIAEEILDSCDEDNLSIEDLVLFLQSMVKGKYGEITEISITKFMMLFEKHRQERYEAIRQLRENQHYQFKGMGHAERTRVIDPLESHFAELGNRMSELKETVKQLRQQNE